MIKEAVRDFGLVLGSLLLLLTVAIAVALVVLVAAVFAFPLAWAWNGVMPHVFGAEQMGWREAFCAEILLLLLSNVLRAKVEL